MEKHPNAYDGNTAEAIVVLEHMASLLYLALGAFALYAGVDDWLYLILVGVLSSPLWNFLSKSATNLKRMKVGRWIVNLIIGPIVIVTIIMRVASNIH